jgi:hypothetical protein
MGGRTDRRPGCTACVAAFNSHQTAARRSRSCAQQKLIKMREAVNKPNRSAGHATTDLRHLPHRRQRLPPPNVCRSAVALQTNHLPCHTHTPKKKT